MAGSSSLLTPQHQKPSLAASRSRVAGELTVVRGGGPRRALVPAHTAESTTESSPPLRPAWLPAAARYCAARQPRMRYVRRAVLPLPALSRASRSRGSAEPSAALLPSPSRQAPSASCWPPTTSWLLTVTADQRQRPALSPTNAECAMRWRFLLVGGTRAGSALGAQRIRENCGLVQRVAASAAPRPAQVRQRVLQVLLALLQLWASPWSQDATVSVGPSQVPNAPHGHRDDGERATVTVIWIRGARAEAEPER